MKKKIRLGIPLALLIALVLTTAVAATGASYDTSGDPIVVYSGLVKWAEETFRPSIEGKFTEKTANLEKELAGAKNRLNTAEQTITALEQKIAALEDKLDDLPAGAVGSGNGYTVIYLSEGTEMLATSVCSIILRSGAAAVVSPFPTQGLNDITTGQELLAGDPLSPNHLMIVPRGNDGRGIRITSVGGAYILVEGGYTLVEP